MARYAYSGRNRTGGPVQGDIEAPTRRDALRILATRGLQVSSVTESSPSTPAAKKAKPAKASPAESQSADGSFNVSFSGKKDSTPKRSDRLGFLEALYDLTSSGLSAGEAVRLLSVRIKSPRMRTLTQGLWDQLSEGVPLSRAMGNFPQVFDSSTANLISAGEATGSLNETLARLIAYLVERRALQQQLLMALIYPFVLMGVAVILILIFLFVLLPRLQGLLTSLGQDMPTSTQILIAISTFALHYGVFILIGLALIGVSFWRWRHTEVGRLKSDAWMLGLPLMSKFLSTRTVLEFSQNLAVLLENGITTSEALKMTERQITNRVHRAAFAEATARVLEGEALSVALTRTKTFPDLVLDRLSIGENTGNVAPSLRDIAKSHQKSITSQLNMFTNLIATVVLVCVFIGVGFIALAIVNAVFSASAGFKG